MYMSRFFSWRPSAANWGLVTTLLLQYVAAYGPVEEYSDGPESFASYEHFGDGAFVDPRAGLRPWRSVNLWEYALEWRLGLKAIHRKKTRSRRKR